MSTLHSMPMFWAEFFADTAGESADVTGAYLSLLGHAWLRGAKLSNDDALLSRLCKVTPRKWVAIKADVMKFWKLSEDGFWTQKRLSKEWEFCTKKREMNRQNGSLGGKTSQIKMQAKSTEDAERMAKHPTPTPTPTKKRVSDDTLKESPRDILARVLSPATTNDVIEHRMAKKAKLTARAAAGLAREFSATGNPEDAARLMIERGWQGFDARWYQHETKGNGNGNGKRNGPVEALDLARERYEDLFRGNGDGERQGVVSIFPAKRF